jgi:hypothetical protein
LVLQVLKGPRFLSWLGVDDVPSGGVCVGHWISCGMRYLIRFLTVASGININKGCSGSTMNP